MTKKQEMDFDQFLKSKEKRRTSRSKGNRTYDKTKLHSVKTKAKSKKVIQYDYYEDDNLANFLS